jgi:hypothetical protein
MKQLSTTLALQEQLVYQPMKQLVLPAAGTSSSLYQLQEQLIECTNYRNSSVNATVAGTAH